MRATKIDAVFTGCYCHCFDFTVNVMPCPNMWTNQRSPQSHTELTQILTESKLKSTKKNDKINVIGHSAGGYSGCRPLFASVSFILVHLIITRCVIDWPKISKAHLDNQSAVVVVEPFSWKLTLFTWHTVDYTLLLNYILKSVGKVLEKH